MQINDVCNKKSAEKYKESAKMNGLLKNISDYLEYLSESSHLFVSVHFSENVYEFLDDKLVCAIMPYNVHKNRYCSAVKRSPELYCKCLLNQRNIIALLDENDRLDRTCFAGVREICYPIRKDGKAVGFVTASGYQGKNDECIFPDLRENALIIGEIPQRTIDSLLPPLCRMIELFMQRCEGTQPSEISRMLKYISDNLSDITLDGVAKNFGRSRSYVSHTFKQKTGKSLRAYCNDLKITQAQRLLVTTDLSVTEIGMESGFADTAYFIRLFRERNGISPHKYRTKQNSKF